MQNIIVNGKLPSTKDECATLAAIQLRIYELAYYAELKEREIDLSKCDMQQSEFKLDIAPINKKASLSHNSKSNNETKNLVLKREESTFAQLNSALFNSRKDSTFFNEFSLDPNNNIPLNSKFILTNGCLESFYFYFKSCGCINSDENSRILSIKHLVAPSYQNSNEIIKLIKVNFLICVIYSLLSKF